MPLHTHTTICGIILLLNTYGINMRHMPIQFGHISYYLHGNVNSSSFNSIYYSHSNYICNVHLGYLVGCRLESSWARIY
jgi:hypothetical protein